jgi:hypothetical protein
MHNIKAIDDTKRGWRFLLFSPLFWVKKYAHLGELCLFSDLFPQP